MDSPLNQAHVHASNAEDFKTRGLFVKAAEEHERSAELFKRAMEQTSSDGPRRTLRILATDQTNAAREMHRKVAELQAQGKDPNQPQLPARATSSSHGRHGSQPSSALGTPSSSFTHLSSSSRHGSPQGSHRSLRMADSLAIGESYMMLGQNSDAADPFKDFWHVVEGMLDKFSNPVAFATAPLSPPPPAAARPTLVFSSESESSEPEDIAALAGRPGPRIADRDQAGVLASLADALGAESNELNGSLSSTIKPGTLKGKFGMAASVMALEVFADDDDSDSSDSFLMIPVAPSVKSLQAENARLKEQVKEAEAKLATAQQHIKTRAEQEQQLRDGLLMARSQMQHRLGASGILQVQTASPKIGSSLLSTQTGSHGSPTFDMSFPNLKLPSVPGLTPPVVPPSAPLTMQSRERETMLLRRTRELEDELRLTREENEKQRAQILKFRERWAKLKESAKRKKSARAAAEAGRIDEEPEAEAEEMELRS